VVGYALPNRLVEIFGTRSAKVVYDFKIRFDLVFNYLGQMDQINTEE